MKKLLFVAALLVGVAALRAEPAAPLTAESQRAYFKIRDRLMLANFQERKDLNHELMKELLRLGEAGDPRAAFTYAMYLQYNDYKKGKEMAGKQFPKLLALAQKGDWIACDDLSRCFKYGIGCKEDEAAADRWSEKSRELIKKAVENDDPAALLEVVATALMMGVPYTKKEVEDLLLRLKKHDSKFAEYVLEKAAEYKKRSGK